MSESDTFQGICRQQPSTAVVVCSKVILCILPIAQITAGAMYRNDCPRQHYFPIYLEVLGAFHLLLLGLSFLPCSNQVTASSITFRILSILFFLSWFVTSNVWIYSIYEPNYNQTMTDVDPYCKTLYLFAFWTANMTYIPIGSIKIYSIYKLNSNKNTTQADPYCNETLYLFAFWSTTSIYVLLGVIAFSFCCCEQQKQDDTQT